MGGTYRGLMGDCWGSGGHALMSTQPYLGWGRRTVSVSFIFGSIRSSEWFYEGICSASICLDHVFCEGEKQNRESSNVAAFSNACPMLLRR